MHSFTPASDSSRLINILNDREISYWTTAFGVTEQQLRNAVFIAGKSAEEVEAYLRRNGHIDREASIN
jgi:hypothetical protein